MSMIYFFIGIIVGVAMCVVIPKLPIVLGQLIKPNNNQPKKANIIPDRW